MIFRESFSEIKPLIRLPLIYYCSDRQIHQKLARKTDDSVWIVASVPGGMYKPANMHVV